MRNYIKYKTFIGAFFMAVILLSSCNDFLNPEQGLNITEDKLYGDWYEYRSIEMGLYALQSKLVEQIVILGELRADLLKITENADADMVEIYNFDISKENKYASPTNFFKLISACNKFVEVLERNHPEVMDVNSPIANYDRLYSEVLCMRAWAYFNAVRIYGKVPFIPQSLTTIDEVDDFVNSSGTYIDSIDIIYHMDGYHNDTIYVDSVYIIRDENENPIDTIIGQPIELEKQYYNVDLVIDYFTNELQNKIKKDKDGEFVVGVNHYMDNSDQTWEVSIWNKYALHSLLGIMYLTDGDLAQATINFEKVVFFDMETNRYQLTLTTGGSSWKNMFSNIDIREHVLALWFSKTYAQQNDLQKIFDYRAPHKYMLKPTRSAVRYWESEWNSPIYSINNFDPDKSETIYRGRPGDTYRGYGMSYLYKSGNAVIGGISSMLEAKAEGEYRTVETIMDGADTVVWKYSANQSTYAQDANFPIYRAGGIQLWWAEIYVYRKFNIDGNVKTIMSIAQDILNDGTNYTKAGGRAQRGVRGRVGLADGQEQIEVGNIIYIRDPVTNEIIGYHNFEGNVSKQQRYLEDKIMEERAKELAFEGERFYDLMRVAKRRNDPSYLANLVSDKFPADRRDAMYNYLLNEDNWYIHYFDE